MDLPLVSCPFLRAQDLNLSFALRKLWLHLLLFRFARAIAQLIISLKIICAGDCRSLIPASSQTSIASSSLHDAPRILCTVQNDRNPEAF